MESEEEYGDYDPNSSVIGTYGATDQAGMRWQLDPKDVLDEIEMQLRGQEWKNKKKVVYRKPLMNSLGIGSVKVILRGHLHTSNALTEVTKEEAYSLTHGVAELINDQLYINGEKWGVDDSDKTIINNLVEDSVFLFLMRPVDGKERERWTKTYKLQDSNRVQGGISGMFDTGNQGGYSGYS